MSCYFVVVKGERFDFALILGVLNLHCDITAAQSN